MSESDHIDEDEVLRRMLTTPHEKHKPLGKKAVRKADEDKASQGR